MPSSLFPNQHQPTNNPFQIINEFKQFLKSGITEEKAKAILNEKLQSGELSEAKFEELKRQAQQLIQFLK